MGRRGRANAVDRFLDNPRHTEHGVLAGHFAATARRCADHQDRIRIVEDSTAFPFNWTRRDTIGVNQTVDAGGHKADQFLSGPCVCGILMPSRLTLPLDGTPIGLTGHSDPVPATRGARTLKRPVKWACVPIQRRAQSTSRAHARAADPFRSNAPSIRSPIVGFCKIAHLPRVMDPSAAGPVHVRP